MRTSSKATLTGSIAGLGSQYVIGLKAVSCSTGDVLAEAQERAPAKEAVLKALDSAAISVRGKLGESLSSVQKYATPVEEATTSSLEALKAYSLGWKTRFAKGDTAALPFYKRAVELDPNFAMSYRTMAAIYGNLDEGERAAENARKAYDLREKVSERERFSIEAYYYQTVTGELERRRRFTGCGSKPTRRTTCLTRTWELFPQTLETWKNHWRKPSRPCAWSQTLWSTTITSAPPT